MSFCLEFRLFTPISSETRNQDESQFAQSSDLHFSATLTPDFQLKPPGRLNSNAGK